MSNVVNHQDWESAVRWSKAWRITLLKRSSLMIALTLLNLGTSAATLLVLLLLR